MSSLSVGVQCIYFHMRIPKIPKKFKLISQVLDIRYDNINYKAIV